MTEFKQGDRVTHAESGFWPDTYTVVRFDGPYSVKVTGPSGQRLTFTASNLTKVGDDRKPAVKVGDRVLVRQAAAIVYAGDEPAPATVTSVDVQPGRIEVKTDKPVRGLSSFFADAWSVLDDKPKVGDRVRVTSVVEALVTKVHANGFETEGPHYWDQKPDNETRTVEVLERAPKAKTDYAKGTELIVTGDTASWFHSFKSGTRVTVLSGGRGEQGGSYRRGTFGYSVKDAAGNVWDVEERDLEVALPKAYKPGTLVRSQSGPLAARTEAGHWVWLSNGRKSVVITDETVRRDYSNSIVHEPASA